MPDKSLSQNPLSAKAQKEKARQASLLEAPEDKPDSTDSLVSKAFDSDPQVRLKVAQELGEEADDPRAIFALIELSSDKDESVKESAQRALGNFKDEQAEISSLGKMLSERKEVKKAPEAQAEGAPQAPPAAHVNMMPAIERLFAHYEPKRRESAKRKLLPSLQKLFGLRPEEIDPFKGIDKMSGPQQSSTERQSQPFLEKADAKPQNATNFPFGNHEEPKESPRQERRQQPEEEMAEKSDFVPIDDGASEFVGGDDLSDNEEGASGEAEEFAVRHSRFFELAYRIATTPGMGKAELKREQNKLVSGFKHEVESAFKLATLKASEEGLSTFSNLKPGMKNLSFAELQINSISDVAYGPRRRPYLRLSLFDGKKEVPLLVPRERASGITVSDKVAPKKVQVDFLVEKNEVILLVTGKSRLVVYK